MGNVASHTMSELNNEEMPDAPDNAIKSANAPVSRGTRGKKLSGIKKKEMSTKIGKDLWNEGRDLFKKDNVLERRATEEYVRGKKNAVRKCIIATIDNDVTQSSIDIMPDIQFTPSWQKKVRNVRNNLGLTFKP